MNSAPSAERSAPQMLNSFEDLVAFLESQSIPHRTMIDEGTKVIIPTRMKPLESELAIFWADEHSLLQCIHPLPFEVREERIPDIESAILRLNHALMLPGFGFHYESRYIYYRLSVPLRDNGVLVDEVQQLFESCVKTSAEFYELLTEIEMGSIDSVDVVEIAGLIYREKAHGVY
jgi:hypothetical protein